MKKKDVAPHPKTESEPPLRSIEGEEISPKEIEILRKIQADAKETNKRKRPHGVH